MLYTYQYASMSLFFTLSSVIYVLISNLKDFTKGSCVVGRIQLDNQTEQSVAPVVRAATRVHHPQAMLQMSFIRNNAKSHNGLNHFEVTG